MEDIEENGHISEHLVLNLLIFLFICHAFIDDCQGVICLENYIECFKSVLLPLLVHVLSWCDIGANSSYMSWVAIEWDLLLAEGA